MSQSSDTAWPTRTTKDGRVLTLRVGENGPGAYYPAMPGPDDTDALGEKYIHRVDDER